MLEKKGKEKPRAREDKSTEKYEAGGPPGFRRETTWPLRLAIACGGEARQTWQKKKQKDQFADTIYVASVDDGRLFYESLEEMQDSNDVPEGSLVAIYEKACVKIIHYGKPELK